MGSKERKGHTKKKEHTHFESLEELVKKCDNKGYKKRNGDKCKVVETIDLVLVEDSKKQNMKHDLTVSNVKILDGQIPIKNDLKSKIEQEIAEEAIEEMKYDDPSIQKEDIVNSIKSKTEKDMNKVPVPIESIDEPADNDIDTYESSDIVSSEKLKKKKDKKKKNSKPKKKKGGELKEEKQKKKPTTEKSDTKKLTKSNCNKPKYAAKNPDECAGLQRMDSILTIKCKKDKYRKKHKERCKDVMN